MQHRVGRVAQTRLLLEAAEVGHGHSLDVDVAAHGRRGLVGARGADARGATRLDNALLSRLRTRLLHTLACKHTASYTRLQAQRITHSPVSTPRHALACKHTASHTRLQAHRVTHSPASTRRHPLACKHTASHTRLRKHHVRNAYACKCEGPA